MTTPNLYDGLDGVTVEADVAASEIGGTGTLARSIAALIVSACGCT
jgi:hypothetical protein